MVWSHIPDLISPLHFHWATLTSSDESQKKTMIYIKTLRAFKFQAFYSRLIGTVTEYRVHNVNVAGSSLGKG